MARIKDIAELAGVSEATVSRVLNGTVRVNKETEEKVQKAIKKLKYRPSLLARSLRQQDGRMIGLLVPEIHHPTFSLIIDYVEHFTRQKGLNLMLGSTGSNPDTEARTINDMLDRKANGIIALRVSNRSHAADVLKKYNIPFVLLDRADQHTSFPCVMTDNFEAGIIAAGHLHDRGHRKIICVTGPLDVSVVNMRLDGFTRELKKRGCLLPSKNIFEGDFSFQSGKTIAEKILQKKHNATAIWAQNDPMAFGIIHTLIKSGSRVPDDISVMGMDDVEPDSLFIPGLTTVSQPFREMCRLAVAHITEPKSEHKPQIILSPGLVERASVKKIQ